MVLQVPWRDHSVDDDDIFTTCCRRSRLLFVIQQPWYSGHLWTHRSQLNNTKRGTHSRSGRSESYWGETSLGGAFAALIQSQAKHKKWKAEKVATARLSSAVGCAWHGWLAPDASAPLPQFLEREKEELSLKQGRPRL